VSDALFRPIFVPDAVDDAVSDQAWLQAMLDVEAAIARAEARAGVIPSDAADAITEACAADRFDIAAIGRAARDSGLPVPPLVRALADQVGGDAARYVHWGATSQDVLDTAAMLVCEKVLDICRADLDAISEACAGLARDHRTTPVVGRTLLQHALPTTFGAKASGWLVAAVDGRRLLGQTRSELAVQFGGAAGTIASLGDRGLDVLGYLAEELALAEPVVPWHTARTRIAHVGAVLGIVCGTMAKIALDIVLMAQTEVGEVAEPNGARGGSSTMPQKRNPVGSALIIACSRRAQAAAGLLMSAMAQEHERGAGAWHSEWESLSDALSMAGGATGWARSVLEGLEIHPDRMAENLMSTGGLLLAESVSMLLAERMGRVEAHTLVESLCRRAVSEQRGLRDLLLEDEMVTKELSEQEIDHALDPAAYVGSAEAFVDRALAYYERER
jgi:3-carboxy-cis,cis-muconate cycloisomerase